MGDVAPVVAVTGLKREGAVLRGNDVLVVAGGGAPERLAAELDKLAAGAAGIISFGMGGALDPSLRVGDWVIADRLSGAFECACDPQWVTALSHRLPKARVGTAYCDGRMILGPPDKRRLAAHFGALIADMESHVAAEAARRAGMPFAILRCVSDEADLRVPPAVAVAMRPGGGLALGAVFGSILAHPGQLPGLITALARFFRAYSSLKSGAKEIGSRLAFDLR